MTTQEKRLNTFLQRFGDLGRRVLDAFNAVDPLDQFEDEMATPAAYIDLAELFIPLTNRSVSYALDGVFKWIIFRPIRPNANLEQLETELQHIMLS